MITSVANSIVSIYVRMAHIKGCVSIKWVGCNFSSTLRQGYNNQLELPSLHGIYIRRGKYVC